MPSITGSPGFYDVFPPVPAVISGTRDLFPEALFVGAGYDYWLCSGNMPEGTLFTWGVNMAAGNASEAVADASGCDRTVSVSDIQHFS